jgi:hypothetical protein
MKEKGRRLRRCGRDQVWDAELKGFGLQVEATGTKTVIG